MVFLVFLYPHFMEEETSANSWPSAHYHQGQSYILNNIRLTQKVTFLTIIHSFSLLKVSIYLISIQRVLLNLLILTTIM